MNRTRVIPRMTIFVLAVLSMSISRSATAQAGFAFVPVTPCRLVDTRLANGTNGGPILTSGVTRNVQVRSRCGVPTAAKAVALTMTSVAPSADGFFALWPSGFTYPGNSNLNFVANQAPTANFGIISLSTSTLDMSVVLGTAVTGTAHIVVDVLGYYR